MDFGRNGNNGMYMPVAPAYGPGYGYGGGMGGGFLGGDAGWLIILILALMGGGWGFGGGFGGGMMWPMMMGGMYGGGMELYPWLDNSQHISDASRDQMIVTFLTSISDKITAGFGDVQLGIAGVNQNICQTGNAITGAIRDGFAGAEIAANGRQMANMQQLFGLQTQAADCCCKTQTGIADLKYTLGQEGCATRADNNANTQRILDKLCQLELDNERAQRAADQREIAQLRAENSTLRNQSFIANEINQQNEVFYNRLKNCPVNAVPVAGNTPLFVCNPRVNTGGNGGGCGCGSNAFGFGA